MFDTRTNKQIACDGVRIAWKAARSVPAGAVSHARSIDGIVRIHPHTVHETPIVEARTPETVPTAAFNTLWKTMDGIRMPALRY